MGESPAVSARSGRDSTGAVYEGAAAALRLRLDCGYGVRAMTVPSPAAVTADDIAAALLSAEPRCGHVRVLAIEGRAGAGKTTLAAQVTTEVVARSAGLTVITVHADDLYNGWTGPFRSDFPTQVHRWILTPVARGEQARHPIYDWTIGRYTAWREFPAPDVLILEGVGMGHRMLRPDASLLVWVEADGVDLVERVVARDGEHVRAPMVEFMARQEVLHERERTRDHAHLIVMGV